MWAFLFRCQVYSGKYDGNINLLLVCDFLKMDLINRIAFKATTDKHILIKIKQSFHELSNLCKISYSDYINCSSSTKGCTLSWISWTRHIFFYYVCSRHSTFYSFNTCKCAYGSIFCGLCTFCLVHCANCAPFAGYILSVRDANCALSLGTLCSVLCVNCALVRMVNMVFMVSY